MPVASHPAVKLSFLERVDLYAKLPIIFIGLLLRFAWILPFRYAAGWPLQRIFFTSLIYVVFRVFSPRQRLAIAPNSGDAVRAYCTKANLTLKTWEFDCEGTTPRAALHELDVSPNHTSGSKADNIVLWFHGGGYSAPLPGSMLIPGILKYAEAGGASKVFFLEYMLAPGLKYPGQLVQAVASIQYLLKEKHYNPSQIILGGDSAGGNLALALVTHIIEPSPYAQTIEGVENVGGRRFKGLLLLSPWVTLPLDSASFRENNGVDILNVNMMKVVLANWSPKNEIWADFLLTSPGFWEDAPVENIMMTAGQWESFRDDIVRLGQIMELETTKSSRNRLYVGQKEIHDQPAMGSFSKSQLKGSKLEILDWLGSIARQ